MYAIRSYYGEKSFEVDGGEGPAEEISLPFAAALFLQEFELRRGFDPFGENLEPQAMGHGDDRFDDGPVVSLPGEVGDEGAVNFQYIEGKALEIAQGRVAGAEVIDGELDPEGLEVVQALDSYNFV